MYPTLLDTKTGRIVVASDKEYPVDWWTEGGGSCDCNRALVFGDEVVEELEAQFGEDVCCGCTRIVATDVHGNLEGFTKQQILSDMNRDYPDGLKVYWISPQVEFNNMLKDTTRVLYKGTEFWPAGVDKTKMRAELVRMGIASRKI